MSTPARHTSVHDLVIDARVDGARRLLGLSGELDLASAWNLVELVTQLLAEGAKQIVLEIADLNFVDSTGLRAILNCRALCEQGGCELSISPAPEQISPQVRRLLQVTGLLDRLPFAD